jgi:hypothetical protein
LASYCGHSFKNFFCASSIDFPYWRSLIDRLFLDLISKV